VEEGTLPDTRDPLAFESILCATDFSDSAAAALEFAVALARPGQTEIRIVHVRPAPMRSGRPMGGLAHPPGMDEKSQDDLIHHLDGFGRPALAAGVATQGVLRQGDAADEIVREARRMSADLIVMGRHSQGTVNPWILGSVAERVLRQAPCPAAVLRPVPCPGGESPWHVLCALDLGETAAATLEYAVGIADTMGADLSVIHVVTEGPVAAARRVLEALVQRVPASKRGIRAQVVTGVPYQETLGAAQENGACLIVVGSHGGGMVDRPFLGSTTLHLLREAECPVLVVPADVSPRGEETREADVAPPCGRRP
jgi:nucleotide-binding universal stress UspA family protein